MKLCVWTPSSGLVTGADVWAFSRTLFVSASGLENAKKLVSQYKQGQAKTMTPELWHAKKVVDSTLHPGTMTVLAFEVNMD